LADVNERLTFRARTYIRDEIANYTPSDEDLDYPAKLEGSPNTTSETDLRDDENADVFKTWYPPLEKTLSCLSKLYRCLEQAVFTGLAQARLSVTLLLPFCQKIPIHFKKICVTKLLFCSTGSCRSLLTVNSSKQARKPDFPHLDICFRFTCPYFHWHYQILITRRCAISCCFGLITKLLHLLRVTIVEMSTLFCQICNRKPASLSLSDQLQWMASFSLSSISLS
jgi:hypothetical protein